VPSIQLAAYAEPPVQWHEPQTANLEHPNLNAAIEATLRTRRVALSLEHRDLDATIAFLAETNACDEALLTRLKKRRLHLKDEIARIDGFFPA
jgi:hypothetical protein